LEIEKAIRPVQAGFDRQEVEKTLFSKVARHGPLAAQILLVGGMIGAGAGGYQNLLKRMNK